MHTVTVSHTADGVRVLFHQSSGSFVSQGEDEEPAEGEEAHASEGETHTEAPDEGPSPITPEVKELLWGLGAFVVFLVLMRLFLFPRLKKGMEARYGKIQSDLAEAEATRETAKSEVAEYEAALDGVKAEAAGRVDAARRQLESERADRLAEVNQRIGERRSAAVAEAEAAREAAREGVEAAVADVAAMTVQLSTGTRPSDDTVRDAARRAMGAEVST